MNDQTMLRNLVGSAWRLNELVRQLRLIGDDGRTPIDRNRDGYHGHPKAANLNPTNSPPPDESDIPEEDRGWKPPHSDPTGTAGIRPDKAAHSRKTVERQITYIEKNIAAIEDEIKFWGGGRAATAYERRLVEQGNSKPEPGCVTCAQTEVAHGVPRWVPIFRKDACHWCYTFERTTGRKPTIAEVTAHHEGRRIARPA